MSDWRPIDTAPRDAYILAWGPRMPGAALGLPTIVRWGKASHVPFYGWIACDGDPEDKSGLPATHWMPLPEPPQ